MRNRTDRRRAEEARQVVRHQYASARSVRGPGWMLWIRSSYKGRTVDALALEAEEGRGYLR